MAHAEASVDISVDPDTLWHQIGSFQAVDDWHPMLASVDGEGEQPGAVRVAVTKQGQRQIERLREVDPSERFYRYTIDSSPLPVREYVAEFRVAATSAGESRITWASDFELAPGAGDETVETVQTFLTTGLANLQQQYTKKNDGVH